MLSERRQRVLRALIEDYIEYALPVGSRTLTERHRLGVSPATVRNDLSALEDAGFIQQPHTSAGRVPTDAGYRTFVDELLSSGLAEEEVRCFLGCNARARLVTLGPSILRTETAGIVAPALVLYELGGMGNRPSPTYEGNRG